MFGKLHFCLFLLFVFSFVSAQESRLEKLIHGAKEKRLTAKDILEIEDLVQKSTDFKINVATYTLLGKTYESLQQYDKANQFYQKSLYIAEKNHLNKELGYRVDDLANLQRELGNFKNSLKLYVDAKKHFEKVNDAKGVSRINANIAAVYILTHREDEAIKILVPIINNPKVKPKTKGAMLINLGAIYDQKGNPRAAIRYYLEAISILESQKNMEMYTIKAYQNLAKSYIELKEYDAAFLYNRKSEIMMQKFDNNELKAVLYSYYAQIYEEKSNFNEAYKNLKLHQKFNDLSEKSKATLKFENIETLSQLENQKLDLQVKEQKIKLLENEKFATRIRIFFLVLLIIGILFLSYYLIKKQRNKVKTLSHVIHQTEDKLEFSQTKTDKLVMNFVKNNDFIERFKEELKQVQKATNDSESKNELGRLLLELQNFKLINDTKDELFNQVDSQFLYKLEKKFPSLTEEERKICVLIYLNLKNKDMAVILNLSLRSVENCRYRIRKKMDLDSNDNLSTILYNL